VRSLAGDEFASFLWNAARERIAPVMEIQTPSPRILRAAHWRSHGAVISASRALPVDGATFEELLGGG